MSAASASASFPGPWHTWYSLRFLRWCGRLLWNRRTGWTLACLVSALVLYYQWENWRSARELVEARRRLVARVGTDDLWQFAPPKIPDEQNYFAIPIIESWLRPMGPGRQGVSYRAPVADLLPQNFIAPEIQEGKDGASSRLDLDGWAAARVKAGKPATEEPLAKILDRELGDAQGILPRLAEGLNRPFSEMKPNLRAALEAGDNPLLAKLPQFDRLNEFLRRLALHLRAAAHAGNPGKTASTALIMLRFSEAPADHGLVGNLVVIAASGITFEVLHEALSCPQAWTDESLVRLQQRLSEADELRVNERAFCGEAVWGCQWLQYYRHQSELGQPSVFSALQGEEPVSRHGWLRKKLSLLADLAVPAGWYDASSAFYIDNMLQLIGPAQETAWLHAEEASSEVAERVRSATTWWDVRHLIARCSLPMIGNVNGAAAESVFRRRCSIIACALERYRLKEGSYPASLEPLKVELSRFPANDPARPDHLMNYRKEAGGYLLWSIGPDQIDHGGVVDKDWLWRMKPADGNSN